MKFTPGQECVCITKNVRWESQNGIDKTSVGPKYNEVYKVKDVAEHNGDEFISLEGFDPCDWWNAEEFEPVISISELEEILEAQPEYA